MSEANCVFCAIIEGRIPCYKVFENETVLAFLDIGPISPGHTLVIPKAHFDRVDSCPPQVLAEVWKVIGMIASAVTKAMNAPAFNVLCNNGADAGQVVGHVHFHIIPRHPKDGVFTQWPAFKYETGRPEQILKNILQNLQN